jgi:hypothetical protein
VTERADTSFRKLFSEGHKPERRSRTFFSGISTTNTPFDQNLSHSVRPENSTSDTRDIFMLLFNYILCLIYRLYNLHLRQFIFSRLCVCR